MSYPLFSHIISSNVYPLPLVFDEVSCKSTSKRPTCAHDLYGSKKGMHIVLRPIDKHSTMAYFKQEPVNLMVVPTELHRQN